jgi:hypothetical protein
MAPANFAAATVSEKKIRFMLKILVIMAIIDDMDKAVI